MHAVSKPERRRVLGWLATGPLLVAAPAVLKAERLQWVGVTATPAADFIGMGLDFFAKRVAELTRDQIVISSHHGGSLGGEHDHVEALRRGAVHVAAPGQAVLAGWYAPAQVWGEPYLFRDVGHKNRAWDHLRPDYQAAIAEAAGLRPLGAIPRMPRQLGCNRPVRSPADMKGLKIRVPEGAVWRRTFEMFGAEPRPLSFARVYDALKAGDVDGQENPVALAFSAGFFEINSHLSLTGHMMQDNCILVAEAGYQRLSPELKAALDRAARDMEAELRPRVKADDAVVMSQLKSRKVMVTEVDVGAFAATVAGLRQEFEAGAGWRERVTRLS